MRAVLYSVGESPSGPVSRLRATRVVLANDHPALRRSLKQVLEREADLVIVGEASDLEAAIHQVGVQRPRVLVLDLRMPCGFSAERIKRLRALSPSTAIVVTTMHEEPTFATEAHGAGAIGFVLADAADLELPEAVRRAARGVAYTSPRVTRAAA
jgi:two-component system, NarL family, response regulator NreC